MQFNERNYKLYTIHLFARTKLNYLNLTEKETTDLLTHECYCCCSSLTPKSLQNEEGNKSSTLIFSFFHKRVTRSGHKSIVISSILHANLNRNILIFIYSLNDEICICELPIQMKPLKKGSTYAFFLEMKTHFWPYS